jgi:hypothetical protein
MSASLLLAGLLFALKGKLQQRLNFNFEAYPGQKPSKMMYSGISDKSPVLLGIFHLRNDGPPNL